MYQEHIAAAHSGEHHIYTDGSSNAEGTGYGIFSQDHSISRKLSPIASAFTAELFAILGAILQLMNTKYNKITIFCDSQSAIKIINKYDTCHPVASLIQSWLIRLASRKKEVRFCWIPSHTGLNGNEEADKLARAATTAIDAPMQIYIPHRDLYPHVRKKLREQWQEEWSAVPMTNKLRSIRDTLGEWTSSHQRSRRIEIVLSRLRLGHTRLTHCYLMEGRPVPDYCENCLVPLTVVHLLVECPEHGDCRDRAFGDRNPTLSSVIGERPTRIHPISTVVKYLNNIGILSKI